MPKGSYEVTRRLLDGSRLLLLIALTGAGSPRDAANKVTKTAAPKIPITQIVPAFSLPSITTPPNNTNLCVVVWSQATNGIYSIPTNVCVSTNWNGFSAWWIPVAGWPPVTNYVVGWSVNKPITNDFPSTNITFANVGLATNFSIQFQPPTYGLIFLQGSTNLTDFYDLSSTPYLRLTNGAGGTLPWQWFRSRTENTTNWR